MRYNRTMTKGHRDWDEKAACDGTEIQIWFDDKQPEQAREYCQACPVSQECKDWIIAIEFGLPASDRYGIYAGLTPAERREIDQTLPRPIRLCLWCGEPSEIPKYQLCKSCYQKRMRELRASRVAS
jgi:hypothetical protein